MQYSGVAGILVKSITGIRNAIQWSCRNTCEVNNRNKECNTVELQEYL